MSMLRMTCVAALACLFTGIATAQAPVPYQPPRTTDGRPDFQGVWHARWLTTLERPKGVDGLTMSAEEAAAWLPPMMAARARAEIWEEEVAHPDAETLAIVRGEHRTSLIVEPADGRLPITPAGQAVLAAAAPPKRGVDSPEERLLNERCLAGPGRAGMLIAPAGMLRRIVQTGEHVVILTEGFADLRVLAVDGRRRFEGLESWHAAPLARWDGDTLTIETTGFRTDDPVRQVPMSRFPLRQESRVTERFTRIGHDELLYEFSIEDPLLYTRPWRAEYSMVRTDERMFEFACHEANYGLANILRGARLVEERAARGAPWTGKP